MRERKREREIERERASVIVNLATVGNVIPKCSCQTGDSGMRVRVRFLRRWTKYNRVLQPGENSHVNILIGH